jgi:hypothetical protein
MASAQYLLRGSWGDGRPWRSLKIPGLDYGSYNSDRSATNAQSELRTILINLNYAYYRIYLSKAQRLIKLCSDTRVSVLYSIYSIKMPLHAITTSRLSIKAKTR